MNGLQQVALQVLIRGLSLATLPIVCRTLGPEAYATVVALVALHLLATACASFGFHGIIARRLAATPDAGGPSLGAAATLLVGTTILAGTVPLVGWGVGIVDNQVLPWLGVALVAQSPAAMAAALLQVRPGQRGLIPHQAACACASALGPLVGLWYGGPSPQGFLVGLAIGQALLWPWHVAVIRSARPTRPQRSDCGGMLFQGAPLVLGVLASWSCDWIDRIILQWWHPTAESGGYALGAGIALGVLGAVQTGLMLVWSPNHHRDPSGSGPATRQMVACLLLAYLGVAIFSPWLGPIFGGVGFGTAMAGAFLVGAAQLIAALNGLQVQHLMLRYDTRGIMWGTLAAGLMSVGAGFLLIPPWGIWGAGISQILGHGAAAIVLGLRSRHIPDHPFLHLLSRGPRHG